MPWPSAGRPRPWVHTPTLLYPATDSLCSPKERELGTEMPLIVHQSHVLLASDRNHLKWVSLKSRMLWLRELKRHS